MSGAIRAIEAGCAWSGHGRSLEVRAIRNDIVRIRIGPNGTLPEDASWAVLPGPRAARAPVQGETDGFATQSLRVSIDRASGAVVISDLQGRVILEDAGPSACVIDADGFRLTKTLPVDTSIFGLGDKTGPLDRRGRSFVLWNTDAYRFQESTDPLYKAIPFFMGVQAGQAYGLFLDNSFRTVFEFGVLHPERLSIGADGGPIDYYVLAGPAPKSVQTAYAWLTGPPPLPPLWSFGFQQSRYSYGSAAEVRALAARMRDERIPCDVIWFDIDALDRNRPFTIDHSAFPDFASLVSDLEQQGMRSVIITDLHIPELPDQNYAPYDGMAAGGHAVHAADGQPYLGRVWPGMCLFPDFTRAVTRDWWGSLFAGGPVACVAGIWNDMNEPSVFGTPSRTMPLDTVHRIEEPGFTSRDAEHREIHNLVGMQNARATFDGLLAARPDRRPFVMSRASYAGGHRTSVTWTGDTTSSWNHLRLSTPMLLSLGLGGFAFAGCDLGGFSNSPPADLLTRWLQLGMFNPIARNHTDKGTRAQENWVDGEPHTAIRRRAVEERYRLMPYLYTLAEEASRNGLPMMRPLFMEFPEAAGMPLDLQAGHQFMFGPALLVAPAPEPETLDAYDAILPHGDWYDYWTGEPLELLPLARTVGASGDITSIGSEAGTAPGAIRIAPSLERLPVFVRAGSIIPRQPLVQSTAEIPQGALELLVYPGPAARGSLYLDDGVSFDYRRGAYLRLDFACTTDADGTLTITIGKREGNFPPWWDAIQLVLHGRSQQIMVPDHVAGSTITIRPDGRLEILTETAEL